MNPAYYAECTCDVHTAPGPHRPECATEQTQPTEPDNTLRTHLHAWAKATGIDNWLTTADYDDLVRRLTADAHTEWTWRHNAYTATTRATTDRADAERAAATVRRLNPGDPVTLMCRTVTDWTPEVKP